MRFVIMESSARVSRPSLIFCVLLPLLTLPVFGPKRTSVILAWDAPPKKHIVHYRIYYSDMTKAKAAKAKWIDVGAETQASVPNLIAGHTYYFVVTAFNSAGRESQPSTLVKHVVGKSAARTPAQAPTKDRRKGSPTNLKSTAH
jgi:fibronectin type 3 domain-containing protein